MARFLALLGVQFESTSIFLALPLDTVALPVAFVWNEIEMRLQILCFAFYWITNSALEWEE